jgi:hypothetical protein
VTAPPHVVNLLSFSCFDDRLEDDRHETIVNAGGGFPVNMAGGPLALLTARDSTSAIGQLTDAYAVAPYEHLVLRLHTGPCGKLGMLVDEGELENIDPTEITHLYELGDAAARIAYSALRDAYGIEMRIAHRDHPAPLRPGRVPRVPALPG